MLRKPGFPVANCNIKMPDMSLSEGALCEEDSDQQQRRLQLINFGHSQWGFNNWNWAVTKQELDFVDLTNGKYCAGVVAFVSISVKNLDIHRENIGYATSIANTKGFAIYKSRKCAVTNALRETLLSFGGSVAAELQAELEIQRGEPLDENNQNMATKLPEPKNQPINQPPQIKKEEVASNMRAVPPTVKNAPVVPTPVVPPAPVAPVAANARAAPRPPPPAPHLRPNSNVSFVLQPVMPPLYGPRLPPPAPPVFPNAYYEYAGPWHFAYDPFERPHANLNLNFNVPPKNLVVNSRECKNSCREGEPVQYHAHAHAHAPPAQGCWIKPGIFYDGFWTEQKVKKWVAEQVEKDEAVSPSQPVSDPSKP